MSARIVVETYSNSKGRYVMSLGITWYTLAEAECKFGLKQEEILKWVEEGLVRTEMIDHKVVRINVDDLELKIQELTGI